VVAPPEVIGKLVQAKQGADLHTATFNQMVAYEVSHGGFLDRHIQLIRKVYGERRELMLAAMDRYFPPEVEWTHPQGGLFLWGTLPDYMDAADVLNTCIKRKVAFVPGEPFHPTGGGKNTMRINFSNATPENIQAGIQRMGEAIGERLAKQVA
jgi:2-aminoadipate transaminase